MTTLARPETNDGISFQFEGRVWRSVGRAVPRGSLKLVQAGEYAGAPVFRRSDVTEDVIYLRTRDDMVAPFRGKF